MNFLDYKRIMAERNLVTNPAAEIYLATAVVIQGNIKVLEEDGKFHLIPEQQQRKDWYINKAIETSWPEGKPKVVNGWGNYCIQIRNNIVEGGATREVTLIGNRNRPYKYRRNRHENEH